MEPLFKWVGSKRWIAKELSTLVSNNLGHSGIYYEPFAGSAAVFFASECPRAVLCDTLAPLIATYMEIRDNPTDVWYAVKAIGKNANTQSDYESRRTRFNALLSHNEFGVEFAALFIYLNKAGFNGLWRQTRDGVFNVPFGKHTTIKLPTMSDFVYAGQKLQHADLISISMPKNVLIQFEQAHAGDVIFADPPYYDSFDGYDGLYSNSAEFQQHLAIALWQAHLRGAFVIATNKHTPETERWYAPFCEIQSIRRRQNIAGTKEGRKPWNQLIATTPL